MHTRVTSHVGNRGIVLGMLGILWILTAVGVLTATTVRPEILHERLPIWLRVAIWTGPGLLALVATVWRRWDELAWGLLIIPPAERLLSYGVAWVTDAYPPAWRSVLVYLVVVVLINRCAAGLDRAAPWDGRERRSWTQET
jgi:hypothetical protein